MKRPTKKDCLGYFQDSNNWEAVWEDEGAHLRLDRLKHTKCMRLVMTKFVPFEWMGAQDHTIVYSLNNRSDKAFDGFVSFNPSQEEIRRAVYNEWDEDEEEIPF